MKLDKSPKQPLQEQDQCIYATRLFQNDAVRVTISYPSIVYDGVKVIKGTITITPKMDLLNSPLQIQIRGFSYTQMVNQDLISSPSSKINEDTQESIFESEQKIQINLIMGESKQFGNTQRKKMKERDKQQQTGQYQKVGQYFLQGCIVLYQLQESSRERLQELQEAKSYIYPIQFIMPPKIPISLQNILLKRIHVKIRYTLQFKVLSVDKQNNRYQKLLVVPFEIREKAKTFPFQQLVINQKIRCYHQKAKIQDKIIGSSINKFMRCLCPKIIYQKHLKDNKIYQTSFNKYDLFHLQLVAVVSQDYNMFLTARAYKDPDIESLTQNRQKQYPKPKSIVNEVKSMTEVPNDISVNSMKETERKYAGLGVIKIQVEMIGELSNISSQVIFKKNINLNHQNYDMAEGEIMVCLSDYLACPRSYYNQVFSLIYQFKVIAFFGDNQEQIQNFDIFVEEEITKQLRL